MLSNAGSFKSLLVLLVGEQLFADAQIHSALSSTAGASSPHWFEQVVENNTGENLKNTVGKSCNPNDEKSMNIFLSHTKSPDLFLTEEYALVESIFTQYPDGKLYVLGMPPNSAFDVYQNEGYCLIPIEYYDDTFGKIADEMKNSLPPESTLNRDEINAALHELVKLGEMDRNGDQRGVDFAIPDALILTLQKRYGGLYLPMQGLMMNPFEIFLPLVEQGLGMEKIPPVFVERILGMPMHWALKYEDVLKPRGTSDFADGETAVCADNRLCMRYLPKEDKFEVDSKIQFSLASAMLEGMWTEILRNRSLSYQVRWEEDLSVLLRPFLKEREQIFLLPHWVFVEQNFPDGYNQGSLMEPEQTVEIYAPRHGRESSDWVLSSTSKMWLPLMYGGLGNRNILHGSVVDRAYTLTRIGLSPYPYRTQFFHNNFVKWQKNRGASIEYGLSGPHEYMRAYPGIQVDSDFVESKMENFYARMEGGLPGETGGARSIGKVRVNRRRFEDNQTAKILALSLQVEGALKLYCRSSAMPGWHPSKKETGARFCEAGLSADKKSWKIFGSAAFLNSVVRYLAYRGLESVHVPEGMKFQDSLFHHFKWGIFTLSEVKNVETQCKMEMLEDDASSSSSGYSKDSLLSKMYLQCAEEGSQDEEPGSSAEMAMRFMVEEPDQLVTIVAHSAMRCDLLERLADGLAPVYPEMRVIGTCECEDSDPVCDPSPVYSKKHGKKLTTYPVPYDFGLSQGKTKLSELVETKYLLVLDDDFVRTHHTCIECMLQKMHSQWHSAFLPFDLVGFPVLEDERNFGAYRGSFNMQADFQLHLTPFPVQSPTPDGCMRVEFCPMVYLARAERMRTFKWKPELKVGEHEYFFYTNKVRGIQTAVCFDSSFAHARVPVQGAAAKIAKTIDTTKKTKFHGNMVPDHADGEITVYKQRRDRFLELMMGAFADGGITRVMYLFKKYQMTETEDYDDLANKEVAPWDISDGTCGPSPQPVHPLVLLVLVVVSRPENFQHRQYLRTVQESFLNQMKAVGDFSYTFFISGTNDDTKLDPVLQKEMAMYGDMVIAPKNTSINMLNDEQPGEQLRFLHQWMNKRFRPRWLALVQDNVFVHVGSFVETLIRMEEPINTVAGIWKDPITGEQAKTTSTGEYELKNSARFSELDGRLVVLSRDLLEVLTNMSFLRRAAVAENFGKTLSWWLRPFEIKKFQFPDVKMDLGQNQCPLDAAILHPIPAEMMVELSRAKMEMPPCSVYSSNVGVQLGQQNVGSSIGVGNSPLNMRYATTAT